MELYCKDISDSYLSTWKKLFKKLISSLHKDTLDKKNFVFE